MAGSKFRIDGLRETEAALAELGKSLGRSVLRRVAIKALEPMQATAQQLAPNDPDTQASIAETIIVTTKRPKGEKSAAARAYASAGGGSAGKAAAKAAGGGEVTVFMGPNRDPKAVQQEFGNVNHGPQPFMRPAWDEHKRPALDFVGDELWSEISKTAARKAKREARKAAKGG